MACQYHIRRTTLQGFIDFLFSSGGYSPHGYCLAWEPGLLFLHIAANALIAVAYFSIPVALLIFVRRRTDLPQKGMVLLFSAFILLCGLTHAISILTMFHPLFGLEGVLKLLTAIVSIWTAIVVFRLLPSLLAIPGVGEMRTANARLEAEVATRREAEAALRVVNHEIEERIAARTAELHRSEERYRLAVDGSYEGIWDHDLVRKTVIFSARNREMLGLTEMEFPDDIESWAARVHPDDLPRVRAALDTHLTARTPFEVEYRIRGAGGRYHWWRSRGHATWDAEARPLRLLGINRDVTQDREREDALRAAQRQAEAANVAKSVFLASISHEIRTPMNGIIGMADLLGESPLDENQQLMVDTIIRSGEGLLTIINDVLDFSRIEAGRVELDRSPFDLEDEIRSVCALSGPAIEDGGLNLIVDYAPALPHTFIGDSGRIRQILTNLIGNAIKFTEEGHIAISVRGVEAGGQCDLAIAVADTGIGIPEDKQPVIFDAFQQARSQTGPMVEGTGLGLAISMRLVSAMGGTLAVRSTPGRGSTFTCCLTLPVMRAEGASAPARAPRASSCVTDECDLSGLTVLVAEDHKTNQLLMDKLLTPFVGRLLFAQTGAEAVRMVFDEHPDLVLMDVSMPEMDGLTATRMIRARETGNAMPRCPIIALTANAMKGDNTRCLEAGMDDYLAKPARRADLFAKLCHWRARLAEAQVPAAGE
jgi:hypothetical protein